MLKYFKYLDNLRDSGATNMFGAGAYLRSTFIISHAEADKILGKWMRTFDPNKSMEDRVKEAENET